MRTTQDRTINLHRIDGLDFLPAGQPGTLGGLSVQQIFINADLAKNANIGAATQTPDASTDPGEVNYRGASSFIGAATGNLFPRVFLDVASNYRYLAFNTIGTGDLRNGLFSCYYSSMTPYEQRRIRERTIVRGDSHEFAHGTKNPHSRVGLRRTPDWLLRYA